MTDWLWRLYIFIRAVDNTAANRTAFASAFVNNGSGETTANERKIFDIVVRLSISGNEPAQAFGVNTAAKLSMRDDLRTLLDGLTDGRYAVVANITHGPWQENELALTNFPVTPSGQIATWKAALTFLENEFGLQVIPGESP